MQAREAGDRDRSAGEAGDRDRPAREAGGRDKPETERRGDRDKPETEKRGDKSRPERREAEIGETDVSSDAAVQHPMRTVFPSNAKPYFRICSFVKPRASSSRS